MKPPSLMNVLVQGCVLVAAMGAATSAQSQSPPPVKSESNSIEFAASDGVFQTFGNGSPWTADMRARMEDPRQRAKMREEYWQSIADSHYGVADDLQLDPATFEKLIELLADQQLERSEHFFRGFATQGSPADAKNRMHAEAGRVTKQIEAQREVLGQEKLERYQALQPSLGQRMQIRELDQRLGDSDKFNGSQRERLVELLHEQFMNSIERSHGLNFMRSPLNSPLQGMPSREELQRSSLLQTIAANEEIWREMPESNRQLRERAAEFLTQRQLAMLEQMHAEKLASQQKVVEQMRLRAGLSATIPEQPEAVEVPPAAVNRDVKLSIKVAVNSESPRYLTTVVSSGKSVSLKISQDLSLEATPVVFENDAYNLRVEYFETGVTGKRVIGNMGELGTLKPASAETRAFHMSTGGGSTVLTGSKGYAVEMSALVEST